MNPTLQKLHHIKFSKIEIEIKIKMDLTCMHGCEDELINKDLVNVKKNYLKKI